MTSTIPSKKPYRKAPPQHREIRHELPILHDDQDGVILAEQSQVTEARATQGPVPVHEQKGFSYTKSGHLKQQMDGYEVCNVNFSSSWSLESSSDKEIAGCRAQMNLQSRTLPPVFLHRGRTGKRSVKHSRRLGRRQLGKFMSRSIETVVVSGDEGQKPNCSFKSRSVERSLVFKEPAEVLAPRKFRAPPIHLPLKGILKQTGTLEVQPENLHKSRSVETLAHSRCSRKYSDPQVCLSRQGKHTPEQNSINRAESIRRREKITEEKLQFSRFLDEITHSVLSPVHLHSLGQCRGGDRNQDSPTSPRCSIPERQKESWPECAKWTAEKSPHLSRKKAEWRNEGTGMTSCRKKPTEEMERAARLRRNPVLVRYGSREEFLSTERQVVDLSQCPLQHLVDLCLAWVSSELQQHLPLSKTPSQEGGCNKGPTCSE